MLVAKNLGSAPTTAITIEQQFCFGWFPSPSFVSGNRGWVRGRFPNCQGRRDYSPSCLHFIGTGEQRLVSHHAVEQQPIVSIGVGDPKGRTILEIHVYRAAPQTWPWHLGIKPQRNAFIRLNA